MRKSWIYFYYIVSLFTFPYLLTVFINDADTITLNRKLEPETLLPFIVQMQISSDYEEETVKAQAVIARSNFYRQIEEKKDFATICEELKIYLEREDVFFEIPDQIYEKAVSETSGQILTVNGELKLVPYHELSSGMTRNGEDAFHDSEYAYLQAVNSSVDKDSPDYLNSTYIMEQQLPEDISVAERDASGYVISLKADDNLLEAETFTKGMGIASSDFSIQQIGDKIRFLSRGKGHGLGISQYGANELAKEGKNWRELLHTYFPGMEITNYDIDL